MNDSHDRVLERRHVVMLSFIVVPFQRLAILQGGNVCLEINSVHGGCRDLRRRRWGGAVLWMNRRDTESLFCMDIILQGRNVLKKGIMRED
jgi:hypothetical protein